MIGNMRGLPVELKTPCVLGGSSPRKILEQALGVKLTSKQYACHKCNNSDCINVEHLYVGTPSDNAHDVTCDRVNNPEKFKERHRRKQLQNALIATERQQAIEAMSVHLNGWLRQIPELHSAVAYDLELLSSFLALDTVIVLHGSCRARSLPSPLSIEKRRLIAKDLDRQGDHTAADWFKRHNQSGRLFFVGGAKGTLCLNYSQCDGFSVEPGTLDASRGIATSISDVPFGANMYKVAIPVTPAR